MFVCCDCRLLSGRGLGDELITRPEESYRPWCVVVCDLETSRIGAPYVYIYDISSLRVIGPSGRQSVKRSLRQHQSFSQTCAWFIILSESF